MTRNRDGLTIRFVREWKNSFTSLTFREYEDVFGRTASICVQPYFTRYPKSRAQCRAAAARKLGVSGPRWHGRGSR